MRGRTLLWTTDLVKRYGALTVTDHVDLHLVDGETHALIGPNGAGKTTLIQQLSGALMPSSGTIHFDGRDVTSLSTSRRVRRGLVRSFQTVSVFGRLSVLDNLVLGVAAHGLRLGDLWRSARLDHARYDAAAEVAQRVGLSALLDQAAGALSHGQRRLLEVGMALAPAPKLLLLDEPMAGLGPDESECMITLLRELGAGMTLLLVEHDMDAVFRLADRVSALVAGRVVATGTPEQVRDDPDVRRAYLGDELAPNSDRRPDACARRGVEH